MRLNQHDIDLATRVQRRRDFTAHVTGFLSGAIALVVSGGELSALSGVVSQSHRHCDLAGAPCGAAPHGRVGVTVDSRHYRPGSCQSAGCPLPGPLTDTGPGRRAVRVDLYVLAVTLSLMEARQNTSRYATRRPHPRKPRL